MKYVYWTIETFLKMATVATKPPYIRNKPPPSAPKPNSLAISTDQLKSTKLRQTNNSFKNRENNNINNNNNNNSNQKPEFLNVALKSRASKEAIQSEKPSNSIQAKKVNSSPPLAAKKPMIAKKPPTDDELRVKPAEEKKNQDQLKYLEDKKMISDSSVSVRNSKFLFEQNAEKTTSIDRRRRTPSKISSGSFTGSQNGGSFTSQHSGSFSSDSGGDVKVNSVSSVVSNFSTPTTNNDEQQDTYDDVSEIAKNQTSKPPVAPELIEEEVYEDVATSMITTPPKPAPQIRLSEQFLPPPTNISTTTNISQAKQNQVIEESDQELYDDVTTIIQPQPLQQTEPEPIEEDVYEDVATSHTKPSDDILPPNIPPPRPLTRAPLAPPPSDSASQSADKTTSNNTTDIHAPLKLEKEFTISDDRLVAPYGLDNWLKSIIEANLTRLNGCFLKVNVELKNSVNSSTSGSVTPNASTIPLEEGE